MSSVDRAPDQLSNQPPVPDLTAKFWEGRYQEGTARWDLGQAAPPLVSLLQSEAAPKPGRMAVLGSGRGHDALLFAEHGFEVVGFDFAPSAIADATTAAADRGLQAQFLQRDIFALADQFSQSFDYVLEHTCFCAILPEQRPDYVRLVQQLLKPEGELIALFWAHGRQGGPPFGASLKEIQALFAPGFVGSFTLAPDSTAARQQEEYLARLRLVQGL
jgi:methyl halide transferase